MSGFRSERGAVGAGVITGGTVLCLALAFFVAVFLPITDPANRAEAVGTQRTYDQLAVQGRTLYIREGCFTCHTQSVRDLYADRGLGPAPSEAGDYLNEAPNLIGMLRLGPDLTCAGTRNDDPNWQIRHLRNPAAEVEYSTMPKYSYLSRSELQALAAYILRLKCGEG